MDSPTNFVDLTHAAGAARPNRVSSGPGQLRDATNTAQVAAEVTAGQNKDSEGRSKLAMTRGDSGKGKGCSSSGSNGVGTTDGDAVPQRKKRKAPPPRPESVRGKADNVVICGPQMDLYAINLVYSHPQQQ